MKDLLPLLEKVAQHGQAAADHRRGRRGRGAGDAGRQQAPRHASRSCAVKAPGFGDRRKAMLEDIAILTGGKVDLRGPRHQARERRRSSDLGRAKQVVDRQGQHHDHRGRRQERRDPGPHQADPPQIEKTTSATTTGEAPGAAREARRRRGRDQRRRRDRDRDEGEEGPRRGRAARDPRGGRGGHRARRRRGAAPRARRALDGPQARPSDEKIGVDIVRRALEEPIRQIVAERRRRGRRSSSRRSRRRRTTTSATTPPTDEYDDLVKAGIIDPTKVTRTALQNAASIAGLLLTTEAWSSSGRKRSAGRRRARAAAWAGWGCTNALGESVGRPRDCTGPAAGGLAV